MNSEPFPQIPVAHPMQDQRAPEDALATLVGEVYESAPASDRRRLLEYLLPPMGVLSLLAVADGIFARIRLRSDWAQVQVGLDDAVRVSGSDVAALVERLQQISSEAVNGLARVVAASPVMASSTAAAVLVALLVQRARAQRAAESAENLARPPSD
jgi:hypothetical protein